MRKFTWLMGLGMLAAVWGGVSVLMSAARERQASAEAVIRQVESRPLESLQGGERAGFLDALAVQVNRLNFEERRQLGLRRGLEPLFEQMTATERQAFLDRTLPQGFAQIIEVFNRMKPEERQAAVARALDDLRRAEAEASEADWSRARARLEDGTLSRVVEEGFQAYLQTASAETKLDLAPVIEQIQQNVRALERY